MGKKKAESMDKSLLDIMKAIDLAYEKFADDTEKATDVLSSEEQKTLVTLTGLYASSFSDGVEKALRDEN